MEIRNCKDALRAAAKAAIFLLSLAAVGSSAADRAAEDVLVSQHISTGRNFTCAVTDSGLVKCWGSNGVGQLGDGTHMDRKVPTAVVGIAEPVVSVATGAYHACALTVSGAVKCWGRNEFGELGNNSTEFSSSPVNVIGLSTGVRAISAGYWHTCAITAADLKCWGGNLSGQVGDGTIVTKLVPTHVMYGAVGVSAGLQHTCAISATHSVRCWGGGLRGQLGTGSTYSLAFPTEVSGLQGPVSRVSAGDNHSCAVLSQTGSLTCWGANEYGELGDGTIQDRLEPVDVTSMVNGVTDVSAGRLHTCAVQNGAAKCWGYNNTGRLGNGGRSDSLVPVDVIGMSSGVQQIAAGGTQSCVWLGADSFSCWGNNLNGQVGNGGNGYSALPLAVTGVGSTATSVKVGAEHACALIAGGVSCWGRNRSGQLGDGTRAIRSTPTPVSGLEMNVTELDVYGNHACALAQSGVAKCWGENDKGQLGDGTLVDRDIPVDVVGLGGGLLQVEAAYGHGCALTATHGVKCWGNNDYGQLGDGSTETRLTPVDVSGLGEGVQSISAGGQKSCALLNTGVVKCWGYLGAAQTTPVDVPEFGSDVTLIDTYGNDCVVNNGQTLRCRGENVDGQLGDGTGEDSYSIPVNVVGFDSGVASVSIEDEHACAVKSNGAAYCWGYNDTGQLGDGTHEYRQFSPVPVSGLDSGVSSISSGLFGTCALLTDGSIKCWGENLYGELGNGQTGSVLEPNQVLIGEEIFRSGFD